MARVVGEVQLMSRLKAVGGVSFMKQLAVMTVREEKLLVRSHKKTGLTENSIQIRSVTPTNVIISVGYGGPFLETGTKPHDITPNVARVLAWGGARRLSGALRSGAKPEFFAMRVHHPGTKPSPFMVPGAKIAVAKTGTDAIVNAWNEAK